MSCTKVVGFRAASVPLARCDKFTEVLVVVLNIQVGLVADVGVCHRSWPLAFTVSRTGESRIESGHISVSMLNDFISECIWQLSCSTSGALGSHAAPCTYMWAARMLPLKSHPVVCGLQHSLLRDRMHPRTSVLCDKRTSLQLLDSH